MRRILILSASYGEGHNSAARALRATFAATPGVEVEIVDLFAQKAPRLDRLSRRAYLRVINHAPRLWSSVYGWLDRSPRAPLLLRTLRGHAGLLARILAARQPDAVVSTYPVYAWLFQQLRAAGHSLPPLHTVVTDALTINSLWYRAPSAGWFVTDADSAAFLVRAGLPATRVTVSGFPVASAFADRAPASEPPDPAAGPRRILYMINSGRARALEIARELIARPDWAVTFTAGRDATLQAQLTELTRYAADRCTVLGWTDRIPELLMTHHVAISKAGGATTQESINALCPMIVNQIVPGQEEGNWELLRRHSAGAFAEEPQAIRATVERAFADDALIWRSWRQNLRRIARPDAARTITAQVLAVASRTASAKIDAA